MEDLRDCIGLGSGILSRSPHRDLRSRHSICVPGIVVETKGKTSKSNIAREQGDRAFRDGSHVGDSRVPVRHVLDLRLASREVSKSSSRYVGYYCWS